MNTYYLVIGIPKNADVEKLFLQYGTMKQVKEFLKYNGKCYRCVNYGARSRRCICMNFEVHKVTEKLVNELKFY